MSCHNPYSHDVLAPPVQIEGLHLEHCWSLSLREEPLLGRAAISSASSVPTIVKTLQDFAHTWMRCIDSIGSHTVHLLRCSDDSTPVPVSTSRWSLNFQGTQSENHSDPHESSAALVDPAIVSCSMDSDVGLTLRSVWTNLALAVVGGHEFGPFSQYIEGVIFRPIAGQGCLSCEVNLLVNGSDCAHSSIGETLSQLCDTSAAAEFIRELDPEKKAQWERCVAKALSLVREIHSVAAAIQKIARKNSDLNSASFDESEQQELRNAKSENPQSSRKEVDAILARFSNKSVTAAVFQETRSLVSDLLARKKALHGLHVKLDHLLQCKELQNIELEGRRSIELEEKKQFACAKQVIEAEISTMVPASRSPEIPENDKIIPEIPESVPVPKELTTTVRPPSPKLIAVLPPPILPVVAMHCTQLSGISQDSTASKMAKSQDSISSSSPEKKRSDATPMKKASLSGDPSTRKKRQNSALPAEVQPAISAKIPSRCLALQHRVLLFVVFAAIFVGILISSICA